jgi:hypothetical protein
MKDRFFALSKTRIRRLHGGSLQRRRGVLLVTTQNLSPDKMKAGNPAKCSAWLSVVWTAHPDS